MPKGTTKNPCPGAGKAPTKITHKPGHHFSGYGKCPVCDFTCALTKLGNLMAHKDRRLK